MIVEALAKAGAFLLTNHLLKKHDKNHVPSRLIRPESVTNVTRIHLQLFSFVNQKEKV